MNNGLYCKHFQSFHKERVKGLWDYQDSYWDVNPAAVFLHFLHTCCANNTPARIISKRICSLEVLGKKKCLNSWHVLHTFMKFPIKDGMNPGECWQTHIFKGAFQNQINYKIHASSFPRGAIFHEITFSRISSLPLSDCHLALSWCNVQPYFASSWLKCWLFAG